MRAEEQMPTSAGQVAESLGVNLTELAGLIGVERNTLAAKTGAREVDAALGPIFRILAMAVEMAGNEQRAAIWFKHEPIPAGEERPPTISSARARPTRCLPI